MRRREFLASAAAAALAAAAPARAQAAPATRPVPSTGERIPVVGLGTWLTFDVGKGAQSDARGEVLRAFLAGGGRLVDSSPMYGAAEEVVGDQYVRIGKPPGMFSATKVWTVGGLAGRRQMENSRNLWKLQRLDLMQVHNFLDWEVHLPTLKAMKADGRLRYIGVTTSHGRRHDLGEQIIRSEKIDFFQVTYSLADREAESRLLPLAAERGTAVIINRPFDGGSLFDRVKGKPLPGYAAELGCKSWAEVMLKWIVAHPAVTCAIPATTSVAHVKENVAAMSGPMPDAAMRARIARDFA